MAPLMMANSIEQCQDIGGYVFEDPHILWEALQMAGSGVFTIGDRSVPDGNKRLAVLGDQALDIISCKKWYEGGQQKRTSMQFSKGVLTDQVQGPGTSSEKAVHQMKTCRNLVKFTESTPASTETHQIPTSRLQ